MKSNKIIIILLLVPVVCFSQQWKRYRREHVYHVGATNFLGDLGGANQIGTHFVKDLEVLATRPIAGFCYRYRLDARQYVRYSAFAGLLKGNDNLTKEQFRNNRNLQFRSPILELSAQYEFSITKDKTGHRYNIRSAKGVRGVHFQVYLFVGVGVAGFYPFGPYPKGGWVALRPLHTEGQGMTDGPVRQYLPVTIVLPYGIGYKHPITRLLSVGVEAGIRYTFSDYIDDVSTNYYDPILLKNKYGNVAAVMSNPPNNSNPSWTAAGQQRGDPKHKDVYMFLSVNLSRKLAPKRTKAKF